MNGILTPQRVALAAALPVSMLSYVAMEAFDKPSAKQNAGGMCCISCPLGEACDWSDAANNEFNCVSLCYYGCAPEPYMYCGC